MYFVELDIKTFQDLFMRGDRGFFLELLSENLRNKQIRVLTFIYF